MIRPDSMLVPELIERLSIWKILNHTLGRLIRTVLHNLNLENTKLTNHEFTIGGVERLQLGHQLDPANEVQGDYLPDILLKKLYPHAEAAGFAAFAFFALGAFTLVVSFSMLAAICLFDSRRAASTAAN